VDPRRDETIALFRFGVIGSLVSGELPHGQQRLLLQQLSRRRYTIPGSQRTHVGAGTIRHWLRAYRRGGFDALKPTPRHDRGSTRRLSPELAGLLVRMKQDHPRMSVKTICRLLLEQGRITPNQIAPATAYRYLARHLPRRPASPTGKEQRRFVHRYPNDCWQADVMYGPAIPDNASARTRNTFLLAFLDDASRLIVAAQFFFSDSAANVKDLFRRALLTYGLPAKLYLDNGPSFRCQDLHVACAAIGCALIYTTPYYPEGKGKIERFFRTVRSSFLSGLGSVTSLGELNLAFDAWLQNLYNRAAHEGLDGATPLDTFLRNAEGRIRYLPAHLDPAGLFCLKASRRVAKNATFTINKRLYQTEEHLIGQTVSLSYDRHDPSGAVNVYYDNRFVHTSYPVDLNANAVAKRRPLHTPSP
jgi:transposase InsO family protein